ncbi:MAG: protein kinase [Planctomycetes bacterium]|nr:protein kinase [Planctomycetota bacterium]
MALEAGTNLGPYEILSPLGAGGMGEVYLATDSKLDRKVAIKVLPESMTRDKERVARFEREAKLLASLNHSNIAAIHGFDDSDGTRFLVMEYVEGETLGSRLRSGPVAVEDALDIAKQIAAALEAAHGQGVIHRDLKPANVMVTKEGRVKVLDFGLAKLAAAGPDASSPDDVTMSAPLTGRGMILGTVPYMSPEQLQGEPVDHRTDLFSLGVMLYEMATGQRPFQGKNSASITSSILRDTPRPLHELNGVLPRHLGRIIEHCLEKDAEQRFQSAKDIRNELRALRKEVDSGGDFSESISTPATSAVPPTLTPPSTSSGSAMSAPIRRGEFWIGVGVIATILIAGLWFWRPRDDSSTSPELTPRVVDFAAIDSLAVLPFANDGGDADAEFLCDGIAESVINSLTSVPELRVISRNTAFRRCAGRNS